MGKRRLVVTISSSEGDEGRDQRPSKSRPSPASESGRKNPRARRSIKSNSRSVARPSDLSQKAEAANFDMLSDEFSECLHDFRIASGLRSIDREELWVDKHKPSSLAELVVQKKKVEEVKRWLEERVKTSKDGFGNFALLITGRAGVGKSAAIHLIASQLDAELCEWITPTPTLWQEHLHTTNSGMQYMSKLDEFETFLEKIRKYSLLRPAYTEGSKKSVILLIDDLPVTNGRVAFARLSKCLSTLVRSTKVPTVILITEYHKTESGDSSTQRWEELESSLERSGAFKVPFNPITVNAIKKTLSKICQEENCSVTSVLIDHIAKASGGDIRHAILSLQYHCLRPDSSFPLSNSIASHSVVDHGELCPLSCSSLAVDEDSNASISFSFGRDETLSLFHALGKFLHNKRKAVNPSTLGQHSFILLERFLRNPLNMDAPEEVLSKAHGQSRPIVDFLHENVLDFISDDAIDAAWMVSCYLSDADHLLAGTLPTSWRQMISGISELDNIAQAIAASVGVRGVLFGNSHPSPSRWHTIRSPRIWQIEQSSRRSKDQLLMERFNVYSRTSSCDMSDLATEFRPRIKWLGSRASDAHETTGRDYNLERNCSWDQSEDDDEIEDW